MVHKYYSVDIDEILPGFRESFNKEMDKIVMQKKEITVTLKSGVRVTGTPQQLKLSGLCDSIPGYYDSGSKGLVPISEMNTTHLYNAIKKTIKDMTTNYTSHEKEQVCLTLLEDLYNRAL